MGRAFMYVILGGGVSAGYAALEFAKRGVSPGELCIISEEHVAPYERPALSKGYLLPEAPARLPSFHTCVGANDERLTPKWYNEHGIELVLGTQVKSADVRRKTLQTSTGETISYKYLIIATGARALRLEEFGVSGSHAGNVSYLRDLVDADRLVSVMKSCAGKSAVVIGGGYIGMECAASLVLNKVHVTMIFPEEHCMARLFTPKIATFYEDHYKSRGVKFVKGATLSSLDIDSTGKVTVVYLRDGRRVDVDMVVVGIGICPNTNLFEGQLALEKGGIKVNGRMQTTNNAVYAVGDVATFPVRLFGETRRLEHVDLARRSARHAVSSIMNPDKAQEFDYLPFFYSRVFTFSWQFYGDNSGKVVHFGDYSGDFSGNLIGAYWVNKGHLVGSFLEGGSKEDYEAIAFATRARPAISDLAELERLGLAFALSVCRSRQIGPCNKVCSSMGVFGRDAVTRYVVFGCVVAASIVVLVRCFPIRKKLRL